ncbi:MAG: hypothetical protein K0R46_3506, partial [Herbinix sp.]|nr:hypothetical protein [Herbinix sp.]
MKFLVTMGEGEVMSSFFTAKAKRELEKHAEVIYNKTGRFSLNKEELMKQIKGVDVLFTGWGAPRLDGDILDCANRLKIHAHTGGSVAPYVSKEEYDRGIVVLSGNAYYAKSVAEGCLAYTLAALRRLDQYADSMKSGGWRPEEDYNQGLIGKKVGIVGYGAIGRYYAELLKWFDVQLSIYSDYISDSELARVGARRASKEEIFSECDVISLHSALNDKNRGMITKNHFDLMKDGALFVNTARAGLVDNESMYLKLQEKRIYAVLDVYEEEPLPVQNKLRELTNVTLYPHIAGPTFDMR